MARVRTFKVDDARGVPDRDISLFLSECEKEGPIKVQTVRVESKTAVLLTFIVTKDVDFVDEPIPA